ncbi:hypothetical protein FEM48_Zijuj01G0084900 [Ziziphus jujuba var. spinosa]|uniref:X8 domain-containing protein n=1 Tax=Ziziphus jujuba var. spinosa TaxID=714518 RepID=A0A978W072_ZIZJJ|nr:hypothetical protein FEM48_Zijuj01G0084900 [Ziziphus jujuba var. spinosa]
MEKGGHSQQWCIADDNFPDAQLLKALDWACWNNPDDCSVIQPNQPCFEPNTLKDHASFAFNSYYENSSTKELLAPSMILLILLPLIQWCIVDDKVLDAQLQKALDWACCHFPEGCSMIQPNKPCFEPNTVRDHASYAFNSCYQKFIQAPRSLLLLQWCCFF